MASQKNDELNILSAKTSKNRSIPYEQYFGEMGLDDIETERRIALAREFEAIFIGLFLLLETMSDIDWGLLEQSLYEDYLHIAKKYLGMVNASEYIDELARNVSYDVLNVTKNHLDDEWYTSYDRAVFDAENEANSVGEYGEYVTAVKSGKTKKTWVTVKDMRVRHTHVDIGGKTIGIHELFNVGNSQFLFPKDMTYDPEAKEVVNCRCWCDYK